MREIKPPSVTLGEPEKGIQLPAGASIPLWFDREAALTMSVRLSDPSHDATPERLTLRLNGRSLGNECPIARRSSGSEWIDVGPITIPPGKHTLCLDVQESVQVAYLAIGGESFPPEALAAAIGAEPSVSDVPPGIEYFTSFDETGMYFFLSYIPWIYNRRIVSGPVLQQSSTQTLSGPYSCLFTENFVGTSALETNNLSIPVGSTTASLGGWIYTGSSTVVVDVEIVIDGVPFRSNWSFANADVGKWVERLSTVTLPPGAHTFYGWIKLRTDAPISTNLFWLDNYGVDFAPLVEPQDSYCIFGDISGNVYAVAESATGTSPAAAWTTSLTGGQILAPPTVSGGTAFVIAAGITATLNAVRTKDGAKLWSASLPDYTEAAAAIYGQDVVVVTCDGWLRAFRMSDGSLDWTLDAWQIGPGGSIQVNGVAVELDRLFFTTDAGVCAVDLAARSVLWTNKGPKAFPAPPAIGSSNVYAGSADAKLYAFDAASGTTSWTYQTGAAINSEPQVLSGAVIVGSDDSTLYALRESDGVPVSQLTFPGKTIRCFLLYSNQLYVVGNAVNGAIYGYTLTISNGTWNWSSSWTHQLLNGAQADPAVDGDDVYVTASDRNVYSLSATDGSVQWTYTPSAAVGAAPVVAPPITRPADTLKFSDVCWLCTHNAYANVADGWFYAQQGPSLPAQLNDGVRALMLDIWVSGSSVVYAHEGLTKSVFMMGEDAFFLPFQTSLAQIRDWLDANPSEIVTLFIEQRTGSKDATQTAFSQSGISRYLFDPVTDWNVQQNGWPTLLWMVSHDKRLVVFSDWGKGVQYIPGGDGFPYVWSYCVENDYGDNSMNGQCNARVFSNPIQSATCLFIQNYNVDFSANWVEPHLGTTLWRRFDRLNDSSRIMQQVQGCNGLRGRLPNFLAVDWYQNGYNGGPRDAVAQINALRRANP